MAQFVRHCVSKTISRYFGIHEHDWRQVWQPLTNSINLPRAKRELKHHTACTFYRDQVVDRPWRQPPPQIPQITQITQTEQCSIRNRNSLAPEEPNIYRHRPPLRISSSGGSDMSQRMLRDTNAICRSYGAPEIFRRAPVYKYFIPTGLVVWGLCCVWQEISLRKSDRKEKLVSLFIPISNLRNRWTASYAFVVSVCGGARHVRRGR
jgi:hypothetical protein